MTPEDLIEKMYGLIRQGHDLAAIDLLKKFKSSKIQQQKEQEDIIELAFDPNKVRNQLPHVYLTDNQLIIDDNGWEFVGNIKEECLGYIKYKMSHDDFDIVKNAEEYLRDCIKFGKVKKLGE